MKRFASYLCTAAVMATVTTSTLLAQDAATGAGGGADGAGRRNRGGGQGGPGGGNFDPEQMRQRMMDRYREQLAVKDDGEWKIVKERIEKVSETRRELPGRGMGGMGMMFGGRGGPGGPGGGGPGGGGDGGGRRGGGGGDTSPEGEALQKAIEANANADEIKSKLTIYRDAVKAKEAKFEKAQADLRQVLSVKQEASAVLMGLLK